MTTALHTWYTTVTFGSGPYEMPPCGPWPSEQEANEAMDRWHERVGALAGTINAAHNVRIVGPFCTRREAAQADISDYTQYLCSHD